MSIKDLDLFDDKPVKTSEQSIRNIIDEHTRIIGMDYGNRTVTVHAQIRPSIPLEFINMTFRMDFGADGDGDIISPQVLTPRLITSAGEHIISHEGRSDELIVPPGFVRRETDKE